MSATPRWSDSSLETPWREDAEQLRYAPPQWSCIGCYDYTTNCHTRSTLATCGSCCESAVPKEHIQSHFESMSRRVAAVISYNGGYSGRNHTLQKSINLII
ncbi:hypothetical protein TNCV_4347331 [Trichonephila clavipes]|nr:hypothetical protein TNCV_4347331 [Trichonephila clavipes]